MKKLFFAILLTGLFSLNAQAFQKDGCGAGECRQCHNLSQKEAGELLKDGVDRVIRVDFAEVPGLWLVEAEKQGKRFPLYVDFSKSYVVAGNVIRLKDGKNLTSQREAELNRVDVGRIPLQDALVLGNAQAPHKVIVFTDPECPYCKKLHIELQEVVRRDPDIVFLIKLFPLKMHPKAYGISQSIICAGSLDMLEDSFAGRPVPVPLCDTDVVDQTIALAPQLGIRSTPTLVLPDGLVAPGYKKADDLLKLIKGE